MRLSKFAMINQIWNNQKIPLPSNQKFGSFFFLIFLLSAIFFLVVKSYYFSFLLLVLSISILLITLLKPTLLTEANKIWMAIGIILGMIVSPIVLGLIFFGIFTPVAVLLKILKRDELSLKFNKQKSFWKQRSASEGNIFTFEKQF